VRSPILAKQCLAPPRAEGPKAWLPLGWAGNSKAQKKTSPPINGRGFGL